MSTTELAAVDAAPIALFAGATPAAVIDAATEAATALADVIGQRHLSVRIGSRDHVQIEGWQTLGALVGVFALKDGGVIRLAWPKLAPVPEQPPEPGQEPRNRNTPDWQAWKAATAAHDAWQHSVNLHAAKDQGLSYGFTAAFFAAKDGRHVGWGEGRCIRSERTWATRDDYALASMAQTRGQSRALAAAMRFVIELAGYAGTPADDMPPNGTTPDDVDVDALVSERVQEALADAVAVARKPAMLDQEGEHDLAAALQRQWPGIDAWGYLVVLMKQLQTEGVPELAGRALKGWAWWQGQPQAHGNARSSTPAAPVTPPAEQ